MHIFYDVYTERSLTRVGSSKVFYVIVLHLTIRKRLKWQIVQRYTSIHIHLVTFKQNRESTEGYSKSILYIP